MGFVVGEISEHHDPPNNFWPYPQSDKWTIEGLSDVGAISIDLSDRKDIGNGHGTGSNIFGMPYCRDKWEKERDELPKHTNKYSSKQIKFIRDSLSSPMDDSGWVVGRPVQRGDRFEVRDGEWDAYYEELYWTARSGPDPDGKDCGPEGDANDGIINCCDLSKSVSNDQIIKVASGGSVDGIPIKSTVVSIATNFNESYDANDPYHDDEWSRAILILHEPIIGGGGNPTGDGDGDSEEPAICVNDIVEITSDIDIKRSRSESYDPSTYRYLVVRITKTHGESDRRFTYTLRYITDTECWGKKSPCDLVTQDADGNESQATAIFREGDHRNNVDCYKDKCWLPEMCRAEWVCNIKHVGDYDPTNPDPTLIAKNHWICKGEHVHPYGFCSCANRSSGGTLGCTTHNSAIFDPKTPTTLLEKLGCEVYQAGDKGGPNETCCQSVQYAHPNQIEWVYQRSEGSGSLIKSYATQRGGPRSQYLVEGQYEGEPFNNQRSPMFFWLGHASNRMCADCWMDDPPHGTESDSPFAQKNVPFLCDGGPDGQNDDPNPRKNPCGSRNYEKGGWPTDGPWCDPTRTGGRCCCSQIRERSSAVSTDPAP